MQKMKLSSVLLAVVIAVCMLQSSWAIESKKSYIVYLGGLDPEVEASQIKDSHFEFLGSILGSKERADEALIYSYNKQFNGFAAILDEEHASTISEHPNVVSVIQNKGINLHTTHSWEFLRLVGSSSLWPKANYGENIIIANIDTGVWPESKSFSGKGYGPIPSKWKGGCDNETLVPCNNKLIGAKYYNKGFQALNGKLDPSMNSARDHDGHGSHTLSIAGGNFVPNVIFNGIRMGTAKGGSPRARVAAYKVCWPPSISGKECDVGDIMKGFESAIHDGVDVISTSLGGDPVDYMYDGLAIASFHAVMKGITVVFSAGNNGPQPGTVTNVAPWVITVGASTMDREFRSFLHLANGLHLKGLSLPKPFAHSGFHTLINAANAKVKNVTMMDAMLCDQDTLDPEKVKGKILVCLNGRIGTDIKVFNSVLAGAAGVIICNDEENGDYINKNYIIASAYGLPTIHITYADGLRLYAYLKSTKFALGYITHSEPVMDIQSAPLVANLSSRGPNSITPEILKPDVIAPGVNILAAFSEDVPAEFPYKKLLLPYNILSGTSMACPHVAGVVGLLKSVHPYWSPAAIKSAIMTTASITDNKGHLMMDETKNEADPFSRGAGQINPNRAINPGLVYNLTVVDYLDFLCTRGYNKTIIQKFSGQPYKCPRRSSILDFNYPSITVRNLNGTVTVRRRLTNVGPSGTYTVHVKIPAGVSVDVKPSILSFGKKGEEQKFKMTLKADGTRVIGGHVFGELIWSNGKRYHVRSPIVVSAA